MAMCVYINEICVQVHFTCIQHSVYMCMILHVYSTHCKVYDIIFSPQAWAVIMTWVFANNLITVDWVCVLKQP